MENQDEKEIKDDNKIIINLHESSNAKEFESGKRIHQREFDRTIQLIDYRIERASLPKDHDKDKNSRQRYNDTISILGSRGSGKTSFLLSLLKYYKANNEYKNKVEVLEIIDPTLIEEKGHVFLTIISLIEDSVSNKLNLSDCSPNDSSYHQKKEWKDKLRKLADGLPSMDGVGSSLEHSDWQDSEFIMDRGLKSVKAATSLEANFNELIRFALEILGKEKKAFIITLDDIDVDFRKGWPVLETIRKYLTSPQIIVILSGDLKLYSKAIRKQQWKNFGKALLKNEAEALGKMTGYNDLVTEMEGQYLQKVIKPENRIRLTTLYEKIELYKQKIVLEDTIIPDIEIKPFYNKVLAIFGINNEYQAEAYTSFLLNLPIRTQIQFLEELEELNVSNASNIIDAFLSDLYEKDVDVQLATNMPKMLNIIILKLLLKEKNLAEAYQLQPTTDDQSLNSSLTALSFLFSKHVKNNPYLIFDYIVKIGYVRNLLADIDYGKESDKPYSIEELCKSSGIMQDKVLRDVAGNITAYSKGILRFRGNNAPQNYAGIIELTGLAKKAKGKDTEYKIDETFNEENEDQKIAYFPITTSINNWKNTSKLSASIFVLLATIGELTRRGLLKENELPNQDETMLTEDEKEKRKVAQKDRIDQRERDIALGILELSQIRSYLMPDFKKSETKSSKDKSSNKEEEWDEEEWDEGKSAELDKKTKIVHHLSKCMREWIDRYPEKGIAVSPHLLGKIVTRFFFALDGIQNSRKYDNLGDYFYRMIIALVNAIVIEETKEVAPSVDQPQGSDMTKNAYTDLNLNNTITSNSIFNKNIAIAEIYKEKLTLSRWLLSCPLLILYLPNTDNNLVMETKKIYLQFIKSSYKSEEVQPDKIWEMSIYDKLCKVIAATADKDKFEAKQKKEPTPTNQDTLPEFNNSYATINTLISNNILFTIFAQTYDKNGGPNNTTRNSKVRKACLPHFKNSDIERNAIKDFIDFVNNYTGENEEIVNQWKQPQ